MHQLRLAALFAQQRIGLNLQVQPIWTFVILGIATTQQIARDLGVGNFSQRLAITDQPVQALHVGSVVGFGIRNIDIQATTALRNFRKVFFGVDDERALCQQNPVPVHQRKRQGLVDAYGFDADGY